MIENIVLVVFFFLAACSAIDFIVGLFPLEKEDVKARHEMLEEINRMTK